MRDLNPVRNVESEFLVTDPATMDAEELAVEVYNDKRSTGAGSGRKNHFLGGVKVYVTQFAMKGKEGLIYYPLEKQSVFSWIKGELGMRVYYSDEVVEEHKEELQPQKEVVVPPPPATELPPEIDKGCCPVPTEAALETNQLHDQGGAVGVDEPSNVYVVETMEAVPP